MMAFVVLSKFSIFISKFSNGNLGVQNSSPFRYNSVIICHYGGVAHFYDDLTASLRCERLLVTSWRPHLGKTLFGLADYTWMCTRGEKRDFRSAYFTHTSTAISQHFTETSEISRGILKYQWIIGEVWMKYAFPKSRFPPLDDYHYLHFDKWINFIFCYFDKRIAFWILVISRVIIVTSMIIHIQARIIHLMSICRKICEIENDSLRKVGVAL